MGVLYMCVSLMMMDMLDVHVDKDGHVSWVFFVCFMGVLCFFYIYLLCYMGVSLTIMDMLHGRVFDCVGHAMLPWHALD